MNKQDTSTEFKQEEFSKIFDEYRAKIAEITRKTEKNFRSLNAIPENEAIPETNPIPEIKTAPENKPNLEANAISENKATSENNDNNDIVEHIEVVSLKSQPETEQGDIQVPEATCLSTQPETPPKSKNLEITPDIPRDVLDNNEADTYEPLVLDSTMILRRIKPEVKPATEKIVHEVKSNKPVTVEPSPAIGEPDAKTPQQTVAKSETREEQPASIEPAVDNNTPPEELSIFKVVPTDDTTTARPANLKYAALFNKLRQDSKQIREDAIAGNVNKPSEPEKPVPVINESKPEVKPIIKEVKPIIKEEPVKNERPETPKHSGLISKIKQTKEEPKVKNVKESPEPVKPASVEIDVKSKTQQILDEALEVEETKETEEKEDTAIDKQTVIPESAAIVNKAKREARRIIDEAEESIKKEAKKKTLSQVEKILEKAKKEAEAIVAEATLNYDKVKEGAVAEAKKESDQVLTEITQKYRQQVEEQASRTIIEAQSKASNMLTDVSMSTTQISQHLSQLVEKVKKMSGELEEAVQTEIVELTKVISDTQMKLEEANKAAMIEKPLPASSKQVKEQEQVQGISPVLAVHLIGNRTNGKNGTSVMFSGQIEMKSDSASFDYQYLKKLKKYLIHVPNIKYVQEYSSEKETTVLFEIREPMAIFDTFSNIPMVDEIIKKTDDEISLVLRPQTS
jgi:vacuolar-type H+-ATPase subunit H